MASVPSSFVLPEEARLVAGRSLTFVRDDNIHGSDAELESPAWHADVLRETEARMAAGQEKVVDWEDAKREWRQLERKHQMARTP